MRGSQIWIESNTVPPVVRADFENLDWVYTALGGTHRTQYANNNKNSQIKRVVPPAVLRPSLQVRLAHGLPVHGQARVGHAAGCYLNNTPSLPSRASADSRMRQAIGIRIGTDRDAAGGGPAPLAFRVAGSRCRLGWCF